MNAAEIIKKDLDAIYIGNLSTVDDNLTLPENGKYGAQFTWETGEERFIDNTGKVHRPLHGMGNRKVTLTVTATYEGRSESREYVATVLQEAKENIVKEVRKVVLNALVGEEAHLPSVVIVYTEDGRRMTMPVKWNTYEPAKEETVVAVAGVIDGTEKEASAEIHYKKEIVPVKGPEKKVGYFPLGQVRLKEGTLYYKYQKLMEEYLLGIDDDQMLYNFRKATGLDTKGAPPMTGWDEESCKLKGHTTGHYLSGIALAFAATGNPKFLDKVNYMVAELKKCQDAFAATGKYHRGFLSAYSEEQFDLLEVYTKYPEICKDLFAELANNSYDLLADHANTIFTLSSVKAANELEAITTNPIVADTTYMADYAITEPSVDGLSTYTSLLHNNIVQLELGQITPEEATADMKVQLELNLDDIIFE